MRMQISGSLPSLVTYYSSILTFAFSVVRESLSRNIYGEVKGTVVMEGQNIYGGGRGGLQVGCVARINLGLSCWG